MRAKVHGRIVVIAETKEDLSAILELVRAYPEIERVYWLTIDVTEVDRSCEVIPIKPKPED